MTSKHDNPIDYKSFKRRASRCERLRAFAVAFAFDVALVTLFGMMALLIVKGSYYRS